MHAFVPHIPETPVDQRQYDRPISTLLVSSLVAAENENENEIENERSGDLVTSAGVCAFLGDDVGKSGVFH